MAAIESDQFVAGAVGRAVADGIDTLGMHPVAQAPAQILAIERAAIPGQRQQQVGKLVDDGGIFDIAIGRIGESGRKRGLLLKSRPPGREPPAVAAALSLARYP